MPVRVLFNCYSCIHILWSLREVCSWLFNVAQSEFQVPALLLSPEETSLGRVVVLTQNFPLVLLVKSKWRLLAH